MSEDRRITVQQRRRQQQQQNKRTKHLSSFCLAQAAVSNLAAACAAAAAVGSLACWMAAILWLVSNLPVCQHTVCNISLSIDGAATAIAAAAALDLFG